MHASVLEGVRGMHIDHINGNPLDNRRSNLRLATPSNNQANRNALNRNNRSGYMGVYKATKQRHWTARLQVDRTGHHIGQFDDPAEAAWMYDQWKIAVHGEFATLNFVYI